MARTKSKSPLRVYWTKEVRSLLRDRNIVVYGLLLPVFLYPLLLFGVTEIRSLTTGLREQMEPVVAVAGLPDLVDHLEALKPPPKTVPLVGGAGDAIANGTADIAVVASRETGRLLVSYDSASGKSQLAVDRLSPEFERWRRAAEGSILSGRNGAWLTAAPELVDLSANTSTTRALLAMLLPLILIVMCTFGATWPALELTAGEREHNTSETTFLLPLSRNEVALGKVLAVSTCAFVTLCVHLIAMLIAAGPLLAELRGGSVALPSLAWQTLPIVICYGALLSLVFGSIFLLAGSYARNFRDAQAFVTPLQLLMMLPAMLTLLPDSHLDTTTAWIPIYNAGLAFRAALMGQMAPDTTMISMLCLGTCALLCFRATVKRLSDTAFALGFTDPDHVMEKT